MSDANVDPDDVSSNPSGNRPFNEVLAVRLSRRHVLQGGATVAAASFLSRPGEHHRSSRLGFAAVPSGSADTVTVPPGYTAQVLIPWGTPIRSSGPRWKKDASNSAADQAQQVGTHHDGMAFYPTGRDRGLLVLNHESVDQVLLFADGDAVMTRDKLDKALAAHGVTVVEVALHRGTWRMIDSRYNRRITVNTPVRFSGPVSVDHPRLRSVRRPLGTLNNCAHGVTPWNTYLTCEENFNEYLGTQDPSWAPTPDQTRYGITSAGFGLNWHLVDPRFDISASPNEANRWGWVVEIDPFAPGSTPVKRTALGRIKHEGATVTESRGRVVVYTGDDQGGDYVYKYVSAEPWRAARARGRSPLDHGTLYVGRFDDDGSGQWLPLVHGAGPLTKAEGWADQADVLIRTRQAADAVGATPLDRPEWVAVQPRSGEVFLALSNGYGIHQAVTPRVPNPYGHIIRWREAGDDNTATTFAWDIFVLAGDPAYDPRVELDDSNIFGSPDGLWFDPDGRLWIQTDVSNSALNRAEAGHDRIGNNAVLAADPGTGEIRRFLVGPRGCEISGVVTTADQRTMFVNIQHPGQATAAWGAPTPTNPRAVSNWPDFDPEGRPRSATVVVRKRNGGVIGT
jgi:hypothetical protein